MEKPQYGSRKKIRKIKNRLKEIKPVLLKYRRTYLFTLIQEKFPDTYSEKDLMNIWSGNTSSENVTGFLEKFAAKDMKLQLEPAA